MNFQVFKHIEQYKSYKYFCENNSLFYKCFWKQIFSYIQKFIPSYIHQNYINLISLFVIITTYFLDNFLNSTLFFSLGIIYYMFSNGINKIIYSKETNQILVIKEHFDYVSDTIIFGFLTDRILTNTGFQNDINKLNLVLSSSIYFSKFHFESIHTKKIKYNIYQDTSSFLLLCSIINYFKPNILWIPYFIYNFFNYCSFNLLSKIFGIEIFNFFIISVPSLYYYFNTLQNIIKNKNNEDYLMLNKFDTINSFIYVSYYLLKLLIFLFDFKLYPLINIVDTYLIFSLTNSKIFESFIDYKIIIFILMFSFINPVLTCFITTFFTYYFIYNIHQSLLNLKND